MEPAKVGVLEESEEVEKDEEVEEVKEKAAEEAFDDE